MTLLTESRAAFVALQAPYVEPTEKPVIGLSIDPPSGYVFTASKFRQGTMADLIKAYAWPADSPLRNMKTAQQQGIIHIPFLDAD